MKNKFRRFIACLLVTMLMSSDMAVLAESVIKTLTLPAALQIIDEEAFYGNTSIEKVVVPDGTTEIRSRAFANSSLTEIELPDTLTFIADDAFAGCDEFVVSVPEDCYAYDWAVENGYINVSGDPNDLLLEFNVLEKSICITDESSDNYIDNFDIHFNEQYECTEELVKISGDAFDIYYENYWTIDGEDEFADYSYRRYGFYADNVVSTGEVHYQFIVTCNNVSKTLDIYVSNEAAEVVEIIASGSCGEDLIWSLDEEGKLIVSGIGTMNDYNAANPPPWESYIENVKVVKVESGVTSIGDYAFKNCRNILTVSIPASVTEIGANAFWYCEDMESVHAESLEGWLGIAFASIYSNPCRHSGNLYINDSLVTEVIVPEGIEKIGSYMFYGNIALTKVELPDSITTIDRYAFNGCIGLDEINIPSGVTEIGLSAFYGCIGISQIEIPGSVEHIDRQAFSRCTSLKQVTINDGVVSIAEEAFGHCSALTEIVVPASVTSIGDEALYGCTNLLKVTFEGTSIPSIGVDAIPDTAVIACYRDTEVDAWAVENGYEVEYLEGSIDTTPSGTCGENLTWILDDGTLTISGTGAMDNFTVTYDSTSDDYITTAPWFFKASNIETVVICEGVTSIGEHAFRYCQSITAIDIPSSVVSIGKFAVEQCSALEQIEIPDGVESIGWSAFGYCENLKEVIIPDSVNYIDSVAFTHCTALKKVKLPDGLTSISGSMFSGCSSLEQIEIPNTVTSIGTHAFNGCSSLEQIILPEGVTEIGLCAFKDCTNLISINLPESIVNIGNSAFSNCENVVATVVDSSYAHTWCEENNVAFTLSGDAPVLLAPILTVGEKTYQSVMFTWVAVEGAEAYDVYCATDEAGEYAYIGTTEEAQFVHNNLICNTTYYYRVCAMSETLTSEYSNVIGVTTEDQIISLSTPENVVVTVIGENALNISWDAVEGAEGYYVMSDENVVAEITGMNNCNYKWEELEADAEYKVSVKAFCHKNNGDEVVGAESDQVANKTAAELLVEATVADGSLTLTEAIVVNTEVTGNYGDFSYRYTIRKDGEIVAASSECEEAQYSYTPTTIGTYSVVVVVTDSLGRTSGCQIDGIEVKATDLEITNVAIDKSIVMLGESVTITADSNRDNGLTYSANVYCGDVKVDSIIGVGRLTFTPSAIGAYSFAVEMVDEYGESEYVYLNNMLTVIPYWELASITTSTTTASVGDTITVTAETKGDMEGVLMTYTIYKDSGVYRQITDTTQTKYTFYANDAGTYKCVCKAQDAYNNEVSVTSTNITVTRDIMVNSTLGANYGNTLNVDELYNKTVRIDKKDTTITWDKLVDDSYYVLEIGCSELDMDIIYSEKYLGNSYAISASQLSPGYEYDVYVDRYNSSGEYIDWVYCHFVVTGGESLNLEDEPELIVPVDDASVNYNDLTVQWKQMNYAESIEIILEYDCGCDDHEILRTTVDGKTTTYTIPKAVLQDGKQHRIEIIARDSLGYDEYAEAYFYVGCEGKSDVRNITEPVLNNSYMSDGYYRDKIPTYPTYEPITITWNDGDNAEYYSLHLKDRDNSNEEIIYSNITTNYCVVQPTALVSGHRYRAEVYAHHTEDCYEQSEDMWFRAPYKGNLLLDPPRVTSPELSINEEDPTIFVRQDLTIVWKTVTAAVKYDVELVATEYDDIDFEARELTSPSVIIPGEYIMTDEPYALYITAYDANGNYTVEYYYFRAVDSNITAPILLHPSLPEDDENIPAYPEKDLTLIWNAVEGAVEYRVQVRDYYSEDWDIIIDEQTISDEEFTIPKDELYMGGRFKVRIKAIDQYGNGKYSPNYYFQVGSSDYMHLSRTEWTYEYDGGSKNCTIKTSQEWTAECSDSWISVSKISGDASMNVVITTTENLDDFPRSGSVTFTNSAGGCAVFSVTQAGNGSSNTGALKISSPEQGDTVDYAKLRTHWSYNYDHAYFKVKLYDVTSGKTVYEEDQIITYYEDIPQSALTYGHIYQLTVEVYNAQYSKISESSIVFKVESLNDGSGDGADTDDDVLDDTDIPEGVNEIIYAGITDGAEISLDDISVSWQNVIGADYYWVALRDMTLYPDGTADSDVVKIIDQETELLTVNILEGQLAEGHSYRLWIAAHKTDVDTPISGKNIYFTVKNSTDDGDTPEGTDTLIPTATLSVETEQVVLGNQIALSGKVLANGGILNQVRVTVQDAQTGEFCDYAIYDLAAIGAFGYYDQFDLANVYPIVTGEGTYIGTSGSGYAREGSASLYLDTAGDKYKIVVYGKNNGDDEMHVLASTVVTLIGEDSETTGGTVTWNSHTYRLIDESMTWTEAKAYCESLGGYLVTITSAEEQAVIADLLASGGTKNLYWIGLDENLESLWITGEVSDYTNWCAGEPNGSGEKYGEIYRDSAWSPAYTWNDSADAAGGSSYHALSNHGMICEFGDVVVAPKEYNFTLNSAAEELTVSIGDTITFAGEIRAGSAQLVNVQASLLDADDPTKGVRFDRFEDINADTFDLSDFKSIVAGETYSDESQSITVEVGKSYIVMLHVADANGVGFTDRDPNTEGPQGPSILVHVEQSENTAVWNGHTYRLIDEGMTWSEAKAYCESIGGYLATITSSDENTVIKTLLNSGTMNSYWLGARREDSGWAWVTGEEMEFTNWMSGKPDNYGGTENAMMVYRYDNGSGTVCAGRWDDVPENIAEGSWNGEEFWGRQNFGFICEFGDVVIAPKESNYTLNNSSTEITVEVGDKIVFGGEIRAGSAKLMNAQVSMYDADDPSKGVKFDRVENINADVFDLSVFDSITAGVTYSDEKQTLKIEAGKSYIVMLYVADENGVGFTDRDPNTEGPQGPSILVHVEVSDSTAVWNEHTYRLIDEGITWSDAKAYCESLGGHLVTITSAEENSVVANLLNSGTKNSYWLGGSYDNGAWSWITDEDFNYTNWASAMPDNYTGTEVALMMYRNPNPNAASNIGEWNDLNADGTCASQTFFGKENFGFVCEFEPKTINAVFNILYPENNNLLESMVHIFTWTEIDEAYSYGITLRDMTEYPDGSTEPQNTISVTVYKGEVTVPDGKLIAGHKYRFSVTAYDRQSEFISKSQVEFRVRAEDDAAIPSCSQSYVSKQVPVGSELYFTGTVRSNGGELQRVTVAVTDNDTSEFCYYQTLSADEMEAAGANLAEFDLRLISAIDTSVLVTADQDNHLTTAQKAQAVDMNKTGDYTVNIWAMNAGNASATLVSVYHIEMTARDDDSSAPQIFFFEPDSEEGYKSQIYTFTAETTGNVASVKMYIDDYLVTPEINCEIWNGFHFYELTTPIWEAGTRTCRLVVTSTSGETAEASCKVEILDAEYSKLPTPKLTSPVPYSDGEARGVINSPFTVSWEENNSLSEAEISVAIIKDGDCLYTQKTVSGESVEIPNTVLGEVGLYTISVVATQLGHEASDFYYMPLRVYSSVTAIEQDMCLHDGQRVYINQTMEWKHPVTYDNSGHYFLEYYDVSCSLCGYILENHVQATEEYQYDQHELRDSVYCDCGYCVGYVDSDGENAFLNQSSNKALYRTPESKKVPIGYLYPYDSVRILYEYEGMYYVAYYSDTYKRERYGFVDSNNIEPTLTFSIRNSKGSYYVDGVTEGRLFADKIYFADVEAFENIIDYSLIYDDDSKLTGSLRVYNSEYDSTYAINFDISDLMDGDDCSIFALSFTGNLVGMTDTVSAASVTAPDMLVHIGRLNSKLRIAIGDLCNLAGYVYSPDKKTCYAKTRTKAVVLSELLSMEDEVIDAIGKLNYGVVSDFYEQVSNVQWIWDRTGGSSYKLIEYVISEGPLDGLVDYASHNNIFVMLGDHEYRGEEIVEALLYEKLLELDKSAMEEQCEANLILTTLFALRTAAKDTDKFADVILKIVNAEEPQIGFLIEALTTGEYGTTFLNKDMQDAYNLLIQIPGSQTIITHLRNFNNNGLLKGAFKTIGSLIDFLSDVKEAEALNTIYAEYKKELISELKIWAESYKETALYADIVDAIEEIEKLDSVTDIAWQSFWDANPQLIVIKEGIEFGASLFVKAAKAGLLTEGAKAIPVVGQVIAGIDFVHTVTELIGMDLEQALEDREVVQVCIKYYNESYKKAEGLVYAISKANQQKAKDCIQVVQQTLYWQNIMIRHACSNITNVSPSINLPSNIYDALVQMNADQEISESQSIVYRYIDLLEEYFDLE